MNEKLVIARFNAYLALLCLVIFQFLSFSSGAQSLNPQQESAKSLKLILDEIRSEYSVHLIYEPAVVDGKLSKVNEPWDEDVELSLFKVLDPLDLTFVKISNTTFVVKKKKLEDANDAFLVVNGQVKPYGGGDGMPGVTVLVKGTSRGTITDIDGNYSIHAKNESDTLVFSYLGYKDHEVQIKKRSTIDVGLQLDVQKLSEVVVTAVGLESDKLGLGYSIHNVESLDIINSHEPNVINSINSKIAGIQVTSTSGTPGASATIRIRGSRSINGNNSPLLVIDGVPVSNATFGNTTAGVDVSNRAIDVNPNDIEKLTVLKGPSATVLYGTQAANGAIMITTKRGKKSKPIVTFNSSFEINEVNKLPEKQRRYAQGRPEEGVFAYSGPETGENSSYGPLISELEFDGDVNYPYDRNGRLVPRGSGNGIPAIAYDDYENFWVKGKGTDNNISVTGGTDPVKYYFSVGNLHQTGITPSADFRRISLKSNIDAEINRYLRVGVSASYINSGGNRVQRGSNISGVTVGLLRNTPTFDIGNGLKGNYAANNNSTYQLADGTQRAYRGNAKYDSPFWAAKKNLFNDDVNRVIGNINLGFKFTPWLSGSYKFGLDNFSDTRDFSWDINSSSEPLGRVVQSTGISHRINSDFLLFISHDINEKYKLNATIGHNYYSENFESRTSDGRTLSVPGFFDISNAEDLISTRTVNRRKLMGVYADLRLQYQDLIYLNYSARHDWSSTLPEDDNSFFYQAASFALEFTELIGPSRILPYGKFRVSYGQVGNTPAPFQTQNTFVSAVIDGDNIIEGNEFPAFEVNAFERNNKKGNQELKPELTSTLEIGADLKLFQNKIDLDVTYYRSFTREALVTTILSASSGFGEIDLNSGTIQNKGWEITLGANAINNERFSWDIFATFTRNQSLVKELAPDVNNVALATFSAVSSVNFAGLPYGVLSGTRYQRNQEGQMIIGSDGYPLIDPNQGPIGDPNPDWLAGIRNSFSYKNFNLSLLWDIKQGGDLWNGTRGVMSYLGISKESGDQREIRDYIFPGVKQNGEVNDIPVDFANPANGLSGIKWRRGGFLGVAEDNIEDASWMRLREVTFSYSFSNEQLKSLKIFGSVKFSLYARNLILITDYTGVDPETNLRGPSNAQGWDYFNLPNTRNYGVSLNMTLK